MILLVRMQPDALGLMNSDLPQGSVEQIGAEATALKRGDHTEVAKREAGGARMVELTKADGPSSYGKGVQVCRRSAQVGPEAPCCHF